jgi:hypothetical protein
VLDGGPAGLPITAGRPWRHDGYRMHLSGSGPRLDHVRAEFLIMEAIESGAEPELVLHADHVALRPGPAGERWATSLELPIFFWERGAGGGASWLVPLRAATADVDTARSRIVLRSAATAECALFHASSGRIALSDGGRIDWHAEGPAHLIAIAATNEDDLARSLDLLDRRGAAGLGRQRAQHAEQLHRGGAVMRSAQAGVLAEAFEWGKIRGDAMLGAWIAGDREDVSADHVALRLADALLAAGLSQHARTLRREARAAGAAGTGEAIRFAAWIGEAEGPTGGNQERAAGARLAPARIDEIDIPDPGEVGRGHVGADGVASFLTGAVCGLWGIEPDAPHAFVRLAPDLDRLGLSAALSRLRVGPTVLDVRLRRRGEIASLAIRRGVGPPIMMDCTVRGAEVGELIVDGQVVGGPRARFEVRESHDVQLHLRAGPPLSSASS